jgi:hypothetical protein
MKRLGVVLIALAILSVPAALWLYTGKTATTDRHAESGLQSTRGQETGTHPARQFHRNTGAATDPVKESAHPEQRPDQAGAPSISLAEGSTLGASTLTPPSLPDKHSGALVVDLLQQARSQNRLAEFGSQLAVSGTRKDVLTLLEAIDLTTGNERDTLARTLQAVQSHAASRDLQDFLIGNSSDPTVAVHVRDALARVATASDVERLSASLPSDPRDGLVRSYLLGTLARVDDPETVPALADLCLQGDDPGLYTSSAIALGRIATPDAVGALVDIVLQRNITNINDPVSQALMSAANKDSAALLRQEFTISTNPVVRYATAHALTLLNGQTAGQNNSSGAETPR